jgi:hypothetical protein
VLQRLALVVISLWAASAEARRGDVLLAVEPGVASLASGAAQRSWGYLGGASLAIGLGDLIALEAQVDRKRFDHAQVLVFGGSLTYSLDRLPVVPVLGLGFGRTIVTGRTEEQVDTVMHLSVGVDARLWRYLQVGAVLRYYPLFQTDLFAPAYTVLNARIGFFWGE